MTRFKIVVLKIVCYLIILSSYSRWTSRNWNLTVFMTQMLIFKGRFIARSLMILDFGATPVSTLQDLFKYEGYSSYHLLYLQVRRLITLLDLCLEILVDVIIIIIKFSVRFIYLVYCLVYLFKVFYSYISTLTAFFFIPLHMNWITILCIYVIDVLMIFRRFLFLM